MDLQAMVDKMNEDMRLERGKEYNLGQLINDLEEYKDEFIDIEFEDGTIPQTLDSWRGSYNCLSLEYEAEGNKSSYELYRQCFNANGSMFTGYKGGDFIMDSDTPIYKANYGECGNSEKIVGIRKEKDKIILIVKGEEE